MSTPPPSTGALEAIGRTVMAGHERDRFARPLPAGTESVTRLVTTDLEAIRYNPLDDDVLAKRLRVPQRQSVNQAARQLEAQGLLRRYGGRDGKIVNERTNAASAILPAASTPPLPVSPPGNAVSEGEVKEAVRDHLAGQGFDVQVA